MEKSGLKDLTDDDLKKKEKGLKALIVLLTVATALLLAVIIYESLNGEELEMSLIIIAICSIGGGVSIYPQLKAIQDELSRRGGL